MVGVEENKETNLFTITPKANNSEVIITTGDINDNLILNLYSITGQLVRSEDIINTTTSIPFNFERGIYLYEFTDKNGQIISSGKFNF